MSNLLTQVYGRGWAFPPEFPMSGVRMAEGAEDVNQSLSILFSTMPGERIMREDYGCDLNQFMFSGISNALLSDIEMQIQESILRYEPRAEVIRIDFDTQHMKNGQLAIQIIYCLLGSDIQQQLTGKLDIADGRGVLL
ncbi:GPW/gp25 family protein [Enterobacter ludwigii]